MDSPFDNTSNSTRLALEWRFRSLEAIHLHYITNTITKKEIDLTLFYVCLFTGFYSFIFVANRIFSNVYYTVLLCHFIIIYLYLIVNFYRLFLSKNRLISYYSFCRLF